MLTQSSCDIVGHMRTQETTIQYIHLTKIYPGSIIAVDHINLSIFRGEIFGLLGPNRAGKTMTVGKGITWVGSGLRAWLQGRLLQIKKFRGIFK